MRQFPDWLKKSIPEASTVRTRAILAEYGLNTICHYGHCPNLSECFSHGTATFLLLGNLCTRRCTFCNVPQGFPQGLDGTEPRRIAEASMRLGLKHVVLTSVNRDDLSDGGARIFREAILEIRRRVEEATIEVLTPDFQGDLAAVKIVCEAEPDIYNHNLETVPRLYRRVRPGAQYERSLDLLRFVKSHYPGILTKSGLMVGLGETQEEVLSTLNDLREHQCDIVTIGQYLKPREGRLPVEVFVHPTTFEYYETQARALGFREAYCGPFVRSSYHAGETFAKAKALSS